MLRDHASAQGVHTAPGKVVSNRVSRPPSRCTHQVCTAQRGKGGVPTASHHHVYCRRTPQAAHGHYLARKDMAAALNVTIVANDRGDSPSSYRARALGPGNQEMSRGTT